MAGWKVPKKDEVKDCSLVTIPRVYMETSVKFKIEALMEAYPHREWLGYLVGEKTERDISINDIIIPPHAYSGSASAEPEPMHVPENCVGFIHSHHSMGAFHSGTDDAHVDRNYPLSITVAKHYGNGLDFDALTCQTTPCKKLLMTRTTISFRFPRVPVSDEWLKEAQENIDKGIAAIPTYTPQSYSGIQPMLIPSFANRNGEVEVGFNCNGHFISEQDYYRHLREIFNDDSIGKGERGKDYKIGEASGRWEEDKDSDNPLLTGTAENCKWKKK